MTLERWRGFSKREQLGHIASEIKRAELFCGKSEPTYKAIIERALALIDLTLQDKKWLDNSLPLLCLRDALANAFQGGEDLGKIYAAL